MAPMTTVTTPTTAGTAMRKGLHNNHTLRSCSSGFRAFPFSSLSIDWSIWSI